jgi:hypothetical protein
MIQRVFLLSAREEQSVLGATLSSWCIPSEAAVQVRLAAARMRSPDCAKSRPMQICVVRPRARLARLSRTLLREVHLRAQVRGRDVRNGLARPAHSHTPYLVIHQPDPFMRCLQQVHASRAPGGALALTLALFLIRPAYAARRASCTAWSCDAPVVTSYPRSATRIVTPGREKSISSKSAASWTTTARHTTI